MMQSAIFFAGHFVTHSFSEHTCIVSAEADAKPEKGSTVKLT